MESTKQRRRNPKPRSWVAGPASSQAFGKDYGVPWVAADGDNKRAVQINAAKVQHQIAFHVQRYAEQRRSKGEAGWTLPEMAGRLRTVDYDGLMRILRGDVHMTLLHIADLTNEVGRIVTLDSEVKRL